MSNEILVGAVGLIGALVGSFSNGVVTTFLNRKKFYQDSQYEAYILFLNSLAISGASPPGSENRWKGISGLIEAKSRIALFGSQKVVKGLSEFSKQPRVTGENFQELAVVIKAIRADVGASKIIDLEELLRIILYEASNQ